MSDGCPLCGDSMEAIAGETHNWIRVVYRVDGGPWMAVHDGQLLMPVTRITVSRLSATRIRHYVHVAVPEVELVVQPMGAITYGTAHATCAQPLVEEANACVSP